MAVIDTETQTGTTVSEKVSIGFMVGVGIVVVTSVLAAGAYIGWNKLTAAAPVIEQVTPPQTTTNTTETTNTTSPQVEGEQTDRTFLTE